MTEKLNREKGYMVFGGIILYLDKESAESDPRYHECVKMLQLLFSVDPSYWTTLNVQSLAEIQLKILLWAGAWRKPGSKEESYGDIFSMEDFREGGPGTFLIDRHPDDEKKAVKGKVIQFKGKAVSGARG